MEGLAFGPSWAGTPRLATFSYRFFDLSLPVSESETTQDPPADVKGRYAFVSLGCPKNLVDSERMLGMLQLEGYELVNDPQGADFAPRFCGGEYLWLHRASPAGIVRRDRRDA